MVTLELGCALVRVQGLGGRYLNLVPNKYWSQFVLHAWESAEAPATGGT